MKYRPAWTCMVIAILLWAFDAAAADVSVRAYVDRNTVAAGESVQFRVTINGGDGDVNTDPIKDFKVYARGTSSSVKIINFKSSRQTTYNFMLIPLREGQLAIPALTVDVDGQAFQTEAIQITVNRPSAINTSRNSDVWVTAEVSEPKPFVGQQITYTFKLYHAVQVTDAKFSPPNFDGFEAKEIEKRNAYPKTINGVEHYVTEVNYVLIPQKAGPLAITPAVLQVGVVKQDRRRSRSPFDDFFNDGILGTVDSRVLQSNTVSLEVQPLPPFEGPDMFSGLVGRFDLKAEAEKTDLKVGDSTTIAVTLQGQGNLPDAAAPKVPVPDGFKTYTDNPEEEIRLEPAGYTGKKVFRTALVPVQPGTFDIGPVRLIYFDIAEKIYKTLDTGTIAMQVAPSETAQAAPITVSPSPLPVFNKKKVEFTGRDILPPKEDLDAVKSSRPLSLWVFLIGLAVPLVPFGGLVVMRRLRRKDTGPAARMKARARQALKVIDQKSDPQELLSGLYQALSAAIFAAAGRSGEALTWKEAETLLQQQGLDAETAGQAAGLLARIESCKFSGSTLTADQRRELLDNTRRMVRKLAP